MTPFELSTIGVESIHRRPRTRAEDSPETDVPDATHNNHNHQDTAAPRTQHQPSRPSRPRLTSHHSVFQTSCLPCDDAPPSYTQASRLRPSETAAAGRERLPRYTCTVAAHGKLLLNLESVNPLAPVGEGEWREVYAVLRGTMLSFHRAKDGRAGKLLRTYTLQHAEVGLASDTQHTILVPQTRLAHLIPQSVRFKAWQRDPDQFRPIRQTILRLRAETDQILLADSDEHRIHSLIYALSAAIDISQAIDERSIPKQCTVPRRRRRQRPRFSGDLSDPALIAEQERIMSQVCPRFARGELEATSPEAPVDASSTNNNDANEANDNDLPNTPAREEEEIDMSELREETAARPLSQEETLPLRPTTTANTVNTAYSHDMMYATAPTNFNDEGKWQPPHNRTSAQVQRYIKRIMPVLNAEAPRASDILISRGQRMKINWRMELLEEWELQPPSYKSHGFVQEEEEERVDSLRSASHPEQQGSASINASDDDVITPMEQGMDPLQLTKVTTASTTKARASSNHASAKLVTSEQRIPPEMQGIVFCF